MKPRRDVLTQVADYRVVKRQIVDRLRKRGIERQIGDMPYGSALRVDEADDVLLLCSGYLPRRHLQTHVQELAFAHELAARGRSFALTDDPANVFDKRVAWFLPGAFVVPRLWDYSRQAVSFVEGLEAQGNNVFCSSHETRFWENKGHMHRALELAGVATPATLIVTRDSREELSVPFEPVILKQEHSAGSAGIHYFRTAPEAERFIGNYPFRPSESLIVQEIVHGATRDLRLTMVGSRAIELASYWRIKSEEALALPDWTPTATKYNSTVAHRDIPDEVVEVVAAHLSRLGVRTAGVDLIWPDDDLDAEPLMLEFSPYYQPNPPKPPRYDGWTYKQYKQRSHVEGGYLANQYRVFRKIAFELMEQELY